jgi:hypothetical protein
LIGDPVKINEEWKKTCKILLGKEVGELEEFEKYLFSYLEPIRSGVSAFSSKEIALSGNQPNDTRFIANDEREQYRKEIGEKPFDINKIKDIDSLVSELKERVYYTGNIQLGNSTEIELSNRVIDSAVCYKSHEVSYSKNVSHCHFARYSEDVFGSSFNSKTKFGIKNYETFEDVRIFETVRVYSSSDCYYSANLEGCQNCLYSFNLRNARNRIGNLELAPDKFQILKQKLVGELADELAAKKTLPSILEIISG